MTERIIVLVALLSLLSVVPVHAGSRGRGNPDRDDRQATGGFPAIVNQVIDLLDSEIRLATDGGSDSWESSAFDTAQYRRIGMRMSGEVEDGLITCAVAWQFSPEDEFQVSGPGARIGVYSGDFGRIPEGEEENPGEMPGPLEDGFVDFYVINPGWGTASPLSSFAEVCGLRAKVVCNLSRGFVVFTGPGGDPQEPEPVTGTLSDVKILLRSE